MRNQLLIFLFCITHFIGNAQLIVPTNGVAESTIQTIAIKNVQIIVSADQTIKNGTLLIQNGKVKDVGTKISIPKGAIILDLNGKTIVPTFIESYSSVGMPASEKKTYDPRPQLESLKKGSYYWNEAIQPELDASIYFQYDPVESEKLEKMGFGVAISHLSNGIMRGTGLAVYTGEIDENKRVLNANVGAFLSLKKGKSKQSYPSSQMGSIALIRQAFYDALWYKENKEEQVNLSLEAINQFNTNQLFFEVDDVLEIFRVQKIAKEFGHTYTIFGSGNEYEYLDKLSNEKLNLIIPINFPDAYNVKDPYLSRQIPLSQLKNWELAPSNAYFLSKRNIPFAISSKGHQKSQDFWSHIQLMIERGLSRELAIRSLTEIPAKQFGLTSFGSLNKGKNASFSIFDKDPFVSKNAKLLETWTAGNRKRMDQITEIDIRGKYNFNINGNKFSAEINGSKERPNGTISFIDQYFDSTKMVDVTDTINEKLNISVSNTDVQFHYNVLSKSSNYSGAYTLNGKYNQKIGVFEGQGQSPNGVWVKWSAIKNESFKEEIKLDEIIEVDSISENLVWYPNMANGKSSYQTQSELTYVLRNATIWTNEKEGVLKDGNVIIKNGKIDYVGNSNFTIPVDAIEIDATGLHITSGIIDEHSHIAISRGVNESGQSNSAEVSIGDVVQNDDIDIYRQLSGGVTAAQLLHGSANAIGGQSALVKLKWGYAPDEMLISNAPKFIKFALGENVKQSNSGDFDQIRFPQTRMGVEQLFYDAFIRAKSYEKDWDEYNKLSAKEKEKNNIKAPAKDLELETILEILNNQRFITCHSYIQSEINMLMHVADSMDFKVNTFTHILEGYKVADKMAAHGAGGSTFSDWWAYKYEVNDAIPHNATLMNEQGVVVAINSDDAEMGRRLNQEAAKAVKYGGCSEEDAWKMVTLNPAKLLHLDDRMGSIKIGKDADIVIWSTNPLKIDAKVISVFIDGELLYDANQDLLNQERNRLERARIINKMLADNEKGGPTRNYVKQKDKHWHCDSIGETAE